MGIVVKSYPEALGALTKQCQTVAIAGSHGKSTTTAMIALILTAAGFDPTVIVGTILREFGNSNFRAGKSRYLVIEACEYDGSFLHYQPFIEVITNVDKEHLDYFKTFANVKRAFKDFMTRLPNSGFLVVNADDDHIPNIAKARFSVKEYSLRQKEVQKLKVILKVPGKHNISNALAALQVARIFGVNDSVSFKALSKFQGTWRRFEIVKTKPYTVISDYGHHPNEIAATLQAAREKFPKKKIWLVFQPHQYQRTHYLFKDFVHVFKKAPIDHAIITDIYDVAGREEKTISSRIDAELLVKKINKKNVQYLPLVKAEQFIKQEIMHGEVLIIMGAGTIYKLVDNF